MPTALPFDPDRRRMLALAAGAALLPAAGASRAAALDGPLTLVVPYAPGGATDRVARLVGERLQPRLGVNVIVENRPGAGGRLAVQQVRRATAEQNLVVLGNPALMVVAPVVFKDAGYDPEKDFAPLAHVHDYEFGVAVGPGVPVREFAHLVAWLKANPAQANFGVPATGSLPHFFALMIGEAVGVQAQIVGYKGSGPLANDLIGGSLPVAIDTFETLLPQHQGGRIRILAVSSPRRLDYAKDVPTFREAGFPVEATGWNGFFAPAAMPAARQKAIADAIRAVMLEPELQQRFRSTNMTPVAHGAAETAKMLAAYRAQWLPVVRRSGFQP